MLLGEGVVGEVNFTCPGVCGLVEAGFSWPPAILGLCGQAS